MVLSHPLKCPVTCIQGHGFAEAIAAVLGGRSYAFISSQSWRARGVLQKITAAAGAPVQSVFSVSANPTDAEVMKLADQIPSADVIVALGGGSVLDAAKGIIAHKALSGDEVAFRTHLTTGGAMTFSCPVTALIAVPTTSGTGSEVTKWGTIWGKGGTKYSVNHPALYPEYAVLDPELTVSMPTEVTLSSGLDAMSHAMEAVWNRRHTSIVDGIAEQAIRLVVENLPAVLTQPANIELRDKMQTAAVMAGIAMGTTQTALAHSISYPLTAQFGMPHGIACSFTLAEIAKFNAVEDASRLIPIARAFNCTIDDLPGCIHEFLARVGLGPYMSKYVNVSSIGKVEGTFITPARAANNIRAVDGDIAKDIAQTAIESLL